MTDHASCPHADGVICAATLDDAAADPALTLEGAREMLRDAAAAIRHFHGLAPPALSDDWARANVAHAVAPLQAEIEALRKLCRDMLPVFEAARPLVLNLERLRDAAKEKGK